MKTLQEQQAEAWRLAPNDAEWIAQDGDGDWFSFTERPGLPISGGSVWWLVVGHCNHLFIAERNGWDWRDTKQSREEFEEMKMSERGDFFPNTGEVCLLQIGGFNHHKVRYLGDYDDRFYVYDLERSEFSRLWKDDVKFMPIKSEAEKRREWQITKLQSASQGKQGAPISTQAAINQYDEGCRMTRELTNDAMKRIIESTDSIEECMDKAAAYVTGSGDYE